jgi:hypothetical protein
MVLPQPQAQWATLICQSGRRSLPPRTSFQQVVRRIGRKLKQKVRMRTIFSQNFAHCHWETSHANNARAVPSGSENDVGYSQSYLCEHFAIIDLR